MTDLGKFTNEMYATKKQVREALNLAMIDSLWNQILSYRSNFAQTIPLTTINGDKLFLCCCPFINKKLAEATKKINRFSVKYLKMSNSIAKNEFKNNILTRNLKIVSKSLMIDASDDLLKRIVTSQQTSIDPSCIFLQEYSFLINNLSNSVSESNLDNLTNYLYDVCKSLNNSNDEKDSIFKKQMLLNNSRNAYDGIYEECPVSMVPSLMKNLFEFLEMNDDFDFIVKLAVTSFYIQYLKPFSSYGEEIASLLLKYITLNSDIENGAALICFENLLINNQILTNACFEVQKTIDFTYYFDKFLDQLSTELQFLLDEIIKFEAKEVKEEYYQIEDNDEVKNNDDNFVVDENLAKMNNVDEISDALKKRKVAENNVLNYTQQIALTNVSSGLSEEEALKLERHLVESNPNISQSQAYFYANHCTLGMHYTIKSYKDFICCAYETARSSMDKLVAEGYYSKEPYKNKFLYMPIKRK